MLAKENLEFHLKKDITKLYKDFLTLVENLKDAHNLMVSRLKSNLPKEASVIVECTDFMSEECMKMLRKRILDTGNETIRSVCREVENFNIEYNN